ncbi:MAG TPA: efflux RND transporter periplasmic adaptor subunit [Terracidiphilus sp.]|nr:efflux RND transporter periplasmic adaptor subunit [Terracidiphilus sp.]
MSETNWMMGEAKTAEQAAVDSSLFSDINRGDSGRKRSRSKWPWIAGVIAVILVVTAVGVSRYRHRGRDVAYLTSPAVRADVDDTVDATGTIDAVTTVQVGAQVSGAISKLYADFNSTVHEGELLAVIDPRVYEGQLLQSQANVANAQANLAATKANLANAQAKAAQAKADYDRAADLTRQGIMSPQSFDAAKATSASADAQVTADKALQLQAQAQVSQQEAALKVAETNLAYTKIYAPIDGTVINRAVDVGQTVAASFQTPTLFTIAKDLTKMQLHISTDEGDIGAVRVGQPVTFRVDAFPGQKFEGRISQVRMNATTVQNVVTYETIVDFNNPERKLFPGMTAYATIPVQSVKDALTVPNSALRYNPDMSQAQVSALLKKYGIEIPNVPAPNASGGAQTSKPATIAMVWKLRADKSIEPVLIQTGVTDHSSTAVMRVIKGPLSPGEAIVTSEQAKPTGFGR